MDKTKTIVVVLDSVGCGEMPDAGSFLDAGANTLANTAAAAGGLRLPFLQTLGLGNLGSIKGVEPTAATRGGWGKMSEASPAKDTTTGHWELMGIPSSKPFAVFPDGFPPEIMEPFVQRTGRGYLCNRPASGTTVLDELAEQHISSGDLIVYTSADSVFQVAAHEEVVPLEELYRYCLVARGLLDPYHVARVIARPFVGSRGAWKRTYNRKDFSMPPPAPTLLDDLKRAGYPVIGIGKIGDIFAEQGLTEMIHTEGNSDGLERTLDVNRETDSGLIFTNLVDFDMVYGHRRNPKGYAMALEEADSALERLCRETDANTTVFVTADHGCDPTFAAHTDHTREFVPLLAYGRGIAKGTTFGTRSTFADLAASIAVLMGLPQRFPGTSVV